MGWYGEGLRFECTRCGNCCTGSPGIVRVSDEEVLALAHQLGLDEGTFRDRYTHRLGSGGTTLREREDHSCVFWREEIGCAVYGARPRQCRTWPFWRQNLASQAHWDRAARGCPGIGQGTLHGPDAIERSVSDDGTSGSVPEL